MATVFLGRISGAGGFQRFVGIKRLHPHLAREPEFIEMFLDEARLAARIHHPNVVPILEIGTSDQGYYIVMEYVEGDTLANLIARSVQGGRRLPVPVATRIIVDVLSGLHAAHELADDDGKPLGIVHRDVSPQNILIGMDGSARLTDFGVARATSKLSTTRTGQLKGKLAYMAPEQARGTRDIDRRADIFAAGVVLWEALEGRRLFKGDGEADTLNKVLNETIPPLRSAEPSIPHELEAVLERALDRERIRRFPTAAAFADALEAVAHESGEVATHKDVAAYLDEVLGTEILKQRETVRALIARTEPSRPRSLSMPPPAPTAPTLPRLGQRPLSPESTPSSAASVSSAVISNHVLPRPAVSSPEARPPPPSRRSPRWPWLLIAVGLMAGTIGVMRWTGNRGDDLSAPRGSQGGAAASIAPAPSSAPDEPAATAPATASVALQAAAAGSAAQMPLAALSVVDGGASVARPEAASSSQAAQTGPRTPHLAGTKASPSPAPVPDDISRNPYR
jgi:eukaryotic-like serine/threonine-protein kinase